MKKFHNEYFREQKLTVLSVRSVLAVSVSLLVKQERNRGISNGKYLLVFIWISPQNKTSCIRDDMQ